MRYLLTLHLLATLIWVGGMFFAHMALRPAANATLAPPQRLPLMAAVFGRFFPWVWLSVVTLLATGYAMLLGYLGGFASAAPYVHAMAGIAWLMTAIFLFIYFVPYPGLKRAVAAGDWPTAAVRLAWIRRLVLTNLLLGLATTVIAGLGPLLPAP